MNNRRMMILATVAILGWAVAIYAVFRSYSAGDSSTASWSHRAEEPAHEHATEEGPPVIKLSDLSPIGFDSATLVRIEPHFHVLNAALVTLVELHERYQKTQDHSVRHTTGSASASFHQTADRHEQMIESTLEEPLRTRFHEYMLRRESEAGLHPDSAWHIHGSRESRNPLPLYRHPETQRPN